MKYVHFYRIFLLLLVAPAWAQEKVTGSWHCGKPDQLYVIPAPDRPNHSFSVYKFRCTSVKPDQIADLLASSDEGAGSAEILGDRERFRNVEVAAMNNRDKVYYDTTGTNTYKNGVFVSGEAASIITGGTGKLKGIRGRVISRGKPNVHGTIWEAQDEYRFPK